MFKRVMCLLLSLSVITGMMLWNVQAEEPNAEELKLISVEFLNSQEQVVKAVQEGAEITVKARVLNSGTAKNATVWVGIYENDTLSRGKYQTVRIESQTTGDFSIKTGALKSSDIIKVHFWCGENKINTYAPTAVFPSSDNEILNLYIDGKLTLVEGNTVQFVGDPGTQPEIKIEMQDSATKVICKKPMGTIPGTAEYKFVSSNGTEKDFFVKGIKNSLTKIQGGMYDGYYMISSINDLKLMAKDSYGYYAVTEDITEPITESFPTFAGKLVGTNSDATAPQMRKISVDIAGTGLFKTVADGAVFENISLRGSVADSTATGVGGFAGTHAGAAGVVKFINCENHASVSGSGRVGGFIGDAYMPESGFIVNVDGCLNAGNITASSADACGGIIGICQIDCVIRKTANTGSVASVKNNVGGMVGWTYGCLTIEDCYNTGTITANAYAGGMVGLMQKNGGNIVKNCFNTGTIKGTQSGFSPAAGFIGRVEETVSIENCYNIGKINSTGSNAFQIVHVKTAGLATVTNCYYLSATETGTSSDGANAVNSDALVELTASLNGSNSNSWIDSSNTDNYPYPEIDGMPYLGTPIVLSVKLKKVTGGTYDGYYIISSAKHFALIEGDTAGKYVVTNDITEAITTPITEFSGELIGVNSDATTPLMRIIKVNISNNSDVSTGLFQKIGGVTIKNITVEGTVTNIKATGVGGFAGAPLAAGTASFENCINKADVNGSTYVGGFVGSSNLWQFVPKFKNCKNLGSVAATTQGSGGLMGFGQYLSVIENCVNLGDISSKGNSVGGFIGWSYGTLTINNSYNAGNITANAYAGGMVGLLNKNGNSKINNVFNTGKIKGTQAGFSPVGGILGRVEATVTIDNSYNAGDLEAANEFQLVHTKSGGLASVNNCYYLSETDSQMSSDGGVPTKSDDLKNLAATLNGIDGTNWVNATDLAKYPYPEIKNMPYEGSAYTVVSDIDNSFIPNEKKAFSILDLFRPVIANADAGNALNAVQVKGVNQIKINGENLTSKNSVLDLVVIYSKSVSDIMKIFNEGAEGSIPDEIITTKSIVIKSDDTYSDLIIGMALDAAYGMYTIADTQGNTATVNFTNVDDIKNELKDITDAAKNDDMAGMLAALDYIGKIDADYRVYSLLNPENKTLTAATLINDNGLNIENVDVEHLDVVRSIVNTALVLPGFNQGLIGNIENYKSEICPENATGNIKGAMTSYLKPTVTQDGKNAIVSTISNKNFTTIEQLRNEFVNQLILNTVKYPANGYADIEDILRNNCSVIGISMTAYDSLTNENTVLSALNDGNYDNLAKLKEAFDVAVANAGINSGSGSYDKPVTPGTPTGSITIGGGGSSSGGGGGSGGSDNAGGSEVVIPPVDTENKNKVENYKDYSDAIWALPAMQKLVDRNILSGYEDNTLKPNKTITREEFVKLLVSAFYETDNSLEAEFTDVDKNAWYYSYIATAKAKGITSGKSDLSFGIGEYISRQDMAVMICNYLKTVKDELNLDMNNKFADDGNISEYAKESVYLLRNLGVINGYEDGSFIPMSSATRAEASQILFNLFSVIE